MEENWLGTIGKKLFAKFIGVELNSKGNQRKTIESLLEDFRFKTQVKSTLKSKFEERDKSTIQTILTNVDLQDCKGLWLSNEVEKNLLKANDFDPNNEYDLNNVQYLPYVEIFLTDKRIFETTQQVLRRKDLLHSLKNTSLPKKIPKKIDSLESAIFN